MQKKVILVTGVFDVLHAEHLNFLRKAKALGGRLLVGVESDERVRQLKGIGRPIYPQAERVKNVEKLSIADEVFILPEQFSSPEQHKALLEKIKPNILAVSSHSPHLERKRALMREVGGEVVVVHQHNPAISTTILLEQQAQQPSHL